MNFKTNAFIILCFCFFQLVSQKTYYGDVPINWENYTKPDVTENTSAFSSADLAIINDETQFTFYASNNEKILRNITFKINSEKGLDLLKSYKLPESLDPAFDGNYYKQGKQAQIKTPYIKEYTITKFSARKYAAHRWKDVDFNLKYESIKWIRSSGDLAGEFMKEDLSVFHMENLAVGDIVQIVYEAAFNSNYGSNIFYFNSAYPKLHCKYTFVYRIMKQFDGYAFVFPINVKDSLIKRDKSIFKDYAIITDAIEFHNLAGINYPSNSFEGSVLPHVFADFRVYRVLSGSYPGSDGYRINDYFLYRPKNFEWIVFGDTLNTFTKVYDKQFASIRKFISKMPPVLGADSTNKDFFKALCDTFNNFRYLSDNQVFYNESNLRDVYSGDHLLKRRLVESLQWKLYTDILNDSKIFYSVVNVQDKRYGEHSPTYRASYAYEASLIAIPVKNSYIYFMPRYRGMKYHLNELPFYFEGSLALLSPRNFQADTKNKDEHFFKFIKTHRGTYNENTRIENAAVRVVLDSLKADLTIKESLSGQFSTVLRHLYLNEAIDSTIAPDYFKKCVDKPFASNAKIKLSSKLTEFPFRYNFNCTAQLGLAGDKSLRIKNWFSFIISKSSIPEKPTHDYYFDFDFSDIYNFMITFKEPVEIKNAGSFSRKISNANFDLESELITNSETSYLLKVKLVVKKTHLAVEDADSLMEIVKELDSLNDFSFELVRK